MKRAAPFLALAIAACSSGPDQGKGSTSKPAQSGAGYALRSNVTGASLVRLAELPSVKPLPADQSWCDERFIAPKSAAGKLASGKGWHVTQEATFRQFQVVLVVRGLEAMTSGRCKGIDANLAFFEGDRLVGVLFAKGKDGVAIDSVEQVGDHLRVWSPDPVAQGQVNLSGANLSFDRVTGDDLVCGGKYRVPTAILSQTYPEARRTLAAAGWSPLPSKAEVDFGGDLRKRFPETDSCAGTGYGECGFTWIAADRLAAMSITTLGGPDEPTMSGYSVACGGKAPERGS
ncbi:hypothetical protein [Sphingomonas sp.]|uniref:hypothetical protein n=1 Tax=Sphingomonas sp. TaxID=28214 RepID=UPI001B081C52|nr:hypothetical protein [Sphingomonas sp.]MBO9713699.1 hypothetical protein [Sphingomonas sp.]